MIPTFTVNDIFVMMQTLNTKTLIGFADPFRDNSKLEVEKEWENTYKKLHKLKLLDLVDGEVKLQDEFARALWIMSRTNLVVEILKDTEHKSLFYFDKENVVECSLKGEGLYTLYMHGAPDTTWNNVIYPRMLAGVQKRKVEINEEIYIKTADYNSWLLKGININVEKLEKIDGNENKERAFHMLKQSYENKIHNIRLMIFYKENMKWSVEGTNILTSSISNWTFKMINKNGVELLEGKQCTNLEIVVEILDVLRRMKKFV